MVFVNIDIGIPLFIASMLSLCDVSLTYYTLWYERRFIKSTLYEEINKIFDAIMKATKYGPFGLIIGGIISQTLIWVGIGFLEEKYIDPTSAFVTATLMCGTLILVIFIHIHNMRRLKRERNVQEMIREVLG